MCQPREALAMRAVCQTHALVGVEADVGERARHNWPVAGAEAIGWEDTLRTVDHRRVVQPPRPPLRDLRPG